MEYVYFGFVINFLFLLFILISGKIDYLSPFSLNVICWFIVFLVGLFVGDEFYPLTSEIFSKYIIWYAILSIIFFIMYFSQGKIRKREDVYKLKYENIFIFFSLSSCLITLLEIFYVGSTGPYSFFLNLRLSMFMEDYKGSKYILTPFLYLIMMPLFAISLMCENTKTLRKFLILWLLIFIISTMGKLAFLTPLIVFIVIRYAGFKKKINFIAIGFYIATLTLVSFIINNVRSSEDSDKQALIDILGLYLYSPIIAFGEILPDSKNFGEYTFRFVYAVLYKIGLSDIKPIDTVLNYVYVPVPTNVYTVMQPFYQDFGLLGIFYGAVFYGLFFSLIYFKVMQRQGVYLILYSFVSLNLILGFMAETLITNLALSLYLFIISILLWRYCVVRS